MEYVPVESPLPLVSNHCEFVVSVDLFQMKFRSVGLTQLFSLCFEPIPAKQAVYMRTVLPCQRQTGSNM